MINISEIQNIRLREKAKNWLGIFKDWKKSDLSKIQYYKLNNIAPSNAYYWFKFLEGQAPHPYPDKKKSLKNKKKGPQLKFVTLEATTAPSFLEKDPSNCLDTGLKIVFNQGLVLSIDKNFDTTSLSQVLNILEARCL